MTVFTDEKFTGYNFNCTSKSANVGFYHICTVTDSNGNEVLTTKVHYINRTWESYPFQSVFEQAKSELADKLNNKADNSTEEGYDHEFLMKLIDNGYIEDYGELEDGETVLMFYSWDQVRGKYHWEGDEIIIDKPSVFQKLRDLAEKNMLKPLINKTVLLDYVFTDEYARCFECGKVYNTEYGELRIVDYEYVCTNCLNENNCYLEKMIEEAKDDFNKAVSVEADEDKIEALGYEKLDSEKDFSTRMSQWGEASWGCYDTPIAQVKDLCKTYGGFAKLTGVHQFDAEYTLYFPSDTVDLARAEFGLETEEV